MDIDWTSSESEILINPRGMPSDRRILDAAKHLPGHIWVATSGSTQLKWVGLSKEAILLSAQAVNKHLHSTSADIWIHCLPDFHVGGLGIWARSALSGARVVDCKVSAPKWNANAFYEVLTQHRGTLTSLVPTQLFDLLALGLEAPPSLRAAVIGGARLSAQLYAAGKMLRWPLIPTYGATECASQVASARIDSDSPALEILPHMDVKADEMGLLHVKSRALFTCYAQMTPSGVVFTDPKQDGWYCTEDMGAVVDGMLQVSGRGGKVVKVGGELVNLTRLEELFEDLCLAMGVQDDIALVAMPDDRLGYAIHLATAQTSLPAIQPLLDRFHALVMPYERIREVHRLGTPLPRSPLGKVLCKELHDTMELSSQRQSNAKTQRRKETQRGL